MSRDKDYEAPEKVFQVCVNCFCCCCCWEILMFVSDSFFFTQFTSYLLICLLKLQGNYGWKEKDKDTIRLKFYFWGLFYREECFPEPVEIVTLPQKRHLKNIRESSLANYKFEGPSCASVFSSYIQQRLLLVGGVMVIIVGNGHGDTSSNPGQDR